MRLSSLNVLSLSLAAVWMVGCGTKTVDPCSGVTGSCLALQVEGSSGLSQVDSLAISIDGGAAKTSTPSQGKATSLPIAVALEFDTAPTGTFTVAVVGSLAGNVIGSGSASATLTSGQHQTIHVVLRTGVAPQDMKTSDLSVGDLSGLDGSAPRDAATGDFASSPPDIRPPADLCAPKTAAECDDGNPCTVDTVSDSSCNNSCVHTPQGTAIACTSGSTSGVCLGSTCCTGCIHNGLCEPGATDNKLCGKGGADCFDCTSNGATCSAGACSGCTATSCTSAGQTCGSSSCGFNCGSCQDGCSNGTITHYTCSGSGGKSCAASGTGNCGLYAACKDQNTCKTDSNGGCAGDGDCIPSAYCDADGICSPRGDIADSCSVEGADRECQPGLHCTWGLGDDGSTLVGVCANTRCAGCSMINESDWTSCNRNIPYRDDPRHYCVETDICHQAFCGSGGACDSGRDVGGNPRACGTATCTNTYNPATKKSTGTVTGALCTFDSTTGLTSCQTGQTENCIGKGVGGAPCSTSCADANECVTSCPPP